MTEHFQATELLRAANPATNYEIDHEHLDVIVDRVVCTQESIRHSILRTCKMKSASAAAAAVVVTAVVVLLGGGTPTLPALALSATSRTTASAALGSAYRGTVTH